MGTLIFVLVFVALAVTTLVFAMSRGRGGLAGLMHSDTKGTRRFATFLFFISILLLGALVPAWIIGDEINNKDIPAAKVSGLTENEKRGQELFGKRCSMCHALDASNASAPVGPDLDSIPVTTESVLDAIENGRSGNGQMPAQLYTGQDARDVAEFVAKTAGSASDPSAG